LQDYFPVGAMMHPNDDFLSAPELDYDGFRNAMREDYLARARHSANAIERLCL
jgi:hypothetical protein